MNSTERFKELLTQEKAKLESELAGVGRKNPANPKDWEPLPPEGSLSQSDVVDSADITIGFENNAAIVADLETRYNEVLAALAHIEDGTYGTCLVGGEPIEEARLTADPAARTCLKHLNQ